MIQCKISARRAVAGTVKAGSHAIAGGAAIVIPGPAAAGLPVVEDGRRSVLTPG